MCDLYNETQTQAHENAWYNVKLHVLCSVRKDHQLLVLTALCDIGVSLFQDKWLSDSEEMSDEYRLFYTNYRWMLRDNLRKAWHICAVNRAPNQGTAFTNQKDTSK